MKSHRNPARRPQRGVVLLMSLIILTVLLAASVALVRSFDTTLAQAGNLAFKRDLANHAETAMPTIIARFQTGGLNTPVLRASSIDGANYSAQMLPTNPQGIPNALLLNNAAFDALPYADIANDIAPPNQGVTIRYLIDRMCSASGNEATLGDQCVGVEQASRAGSGGSARPAPPRQVAYRISVRIDGPRSTQAFFQTVFSL